MSNEKRVYSLLKSEKISVGRGEDGANLCSIPHNENKEVYNINSYSFRIAFKSFWKKEYGELLNDKEVQEIISIIEVECYESKNKIQRNHRIYTKGRMLIYQLNTDNNTSVRIEDGECEIEETPDFMFYTDRNFKNQVEPDLNVMPEELLPYIRKHFNVKDEDDVILISILIVSSMLGMNFNHPVILNKEAIVLRLSKSYFNCFDNVSFISKAISDLLCSAVTGASDTTRRLYTDTEERIVKLHSIIGITSINGVARSSDLVDRSCLIALSRFEKSEIKTEQSVMASFQKDLPFILGAIFNTIAGVLSDRKKVKARHKIRLADFHEKAIKIGRVLGIEEDKISDILFQNRLNLSLSILESSSIAICLKELMADKYEYVNTPTECLNELKHIALQKGIDKSTLPKDGSRLTKALILIRDELSEVYGLDFEQKRGKERLYVITNKNLKEELDEE